tara:strand:- start:113 stop:319 length:207 start_codon:yes stop_codon:yes gene_type:complete
MATNNRGREMNSKSMEKWSGIFLLLSVLALIYIILTGSNQAGGVYSLLIMSSIHNIGASIMKKLEGIK